jgi:hypothetical protein
MIGGTFPTLRRRAAQVREAQLRMLARLQALDAACAKHMQHGAMAGGDPLTDSMFDQMQAAAEEGARPAMPYHAGQRHQPEPLGWWLAGTTLLAALISAALFLPGA